MEKVYILSTRRTAIGSFGGGLKTLSASELGSIAVKASLEAAGVESGAVSELIMGNVLGAGQGMGPGRQTAIKSGLPVEVPGYSINMLCGSGMKAVMTGAACLRHRSTSPGRTGSDRNWAARTWKMRCCSTGLPMYSTSTIWE